MSQTIQFSLYAFGLCAAGAGLVLLLVTSLLGRVNGLPKGGASVFAAIAIPMALILSRLLYVLLNLKFYVETYENPSLMFCFWDGGLSMTGAVIGVLLAGLISASVLKIPFARLADAFAAPLGLAMALVFFGERFTDLGYGKSVPESFLTRTFPGLFGIEKMGKMSMINLLPWKYEAFAFLILFGITLLLFSRNHLREGDTALLFFVLAGAITILLESFRDDGHMLIIFLRVAQLGGLFMVLVPMVILHRRWVMGGNSHLFPLLCWGGEAVGIAGIVLIEFALDGRLKFGSPSMGVNYAAMLGCCILMAVLPCILLKKCGEGHR